MVRKSCFILGIALGIFWWIGLSENQAATVLWFDAVAAVLAFGTAALRLRARAESRAALVGPVLLGLGLADLWIVGMSSRSARLGQLAELHVRRGLPGVAVLAVPQRRLVHVQHGPAGGRGHGKPGRGKI